MSVTATATEPWTTARHPLARLLRTVCAGQLPEPDGTWARVSPWIPTIQAIVAFPEHTILAVSYDVTDAALADLGVDGHGGAFTPRVVASLAGPTGWVGSPHVLFTTVGTGGGQAGDLVARTDLARHPFVVAARRTLQDVQILASGSAENPDIVVLGRGVAGVREVTVLAPRRERRAELLHAALASVPENEVTLLSVPAYDATGLLAAPQAGFTAVGGVQLFSNRPEHKL